MQAKFPPTGLEYKDIIGLIVRRGSGDECVLTNVQYYSSRDRALQAKAEMKARRPDLLVYPARRAQMDREDVLMPCLARGEVQIDQPLALDYPMDYVVSYYTPAIQAVVRISAAKTDFDTLAAGVASIDPLLFDYTISTEPSLYPAAHETVDDVIRELTTKISMK